MFSYVLTCLNIFPSHLYTFHIFYMFYMCLGATYAILYSTHATVKKRVLLLFPGRNSSFVRNACHTYNIHNSCTQLGSIPTPLDLVDEKMTCVGSWETACVDRNWAGGAQ